MLKLSMTRACAFGLVMVTTIFALVTAVAVDHQAIMEDYHTSDQLAKEFYSLQASCPALQVR